MHSHQLIERSLANLAVWRLDPIPSLCSGFSLIAQRNATLHLLHRAPKFRRIMVSSITATNLTLNHLLDNIASLEHQNQNVRCIVDIEGSLDDASSIRWFIRWPSGAGAELTLLHERRRVRPALPHSWFDACNLSSSHLSLSNHSSVRHWDLGRRHGDIGGSFKTPSSDDLSGSSSWGYSWLLFSTGGVSPVTKPLSQN